MSVLFSRKFLVFGVSAAALAAAGPAVLAQTAPGVAQTVPGAASIELDEITVTAPARGPRSLQETPAAAGVIERDEIERREAQTFEDLLGDEAGVSIPGGPRGISQEPNIRGFEDEQIVIRLDGARQNFNLAHRGRFFVDPDVVERVEVLRGGASALYGSGALGGVISLETRKAGDLLEPGQSFGGRLKTSYSSNGGQIFTSGTAYGQLGDVDALGFLSWREMTGDISDGAGDKVRASELDIRNGLLNLGFEPSEALRIELGGLYYEDEGLTPPNANAAASAETEVDRDVNIASGRIGVEYAPAGSDLINFKGLMFLSDIGLEEDRLADGRFDTTDYRTIGIDLANSSKFQIGAPVILTYGLEAYRDSQEGSRNGADRLQFPDADLTFLAGFAQAEISLTDALTLTPGLRYDHFSLDPSGLDSDGAALAERSEGQFSPRLAFSFQATEALTLWASAAQSFRAPSLTQLYNDGVHFAAQGFPLDPTNPSAPIFTGVNNFVPNPELEPEKANQLDFGARLRLRDFAGAGNMLRLSANAYYADVDDYIDSYVTFIDEDTFTFDPVTGQSFLSGTTRTRNVDAKLWGFEAEASYDAQAWFLGAGLTLPRGEGDDGEVLGSLPQDRLTLKGGFRPVDQVEVGARGVFRAGRDGGEDTPGSSVFDVYASYEPMDNLRLQIGVDNVLDREYRIHPNALNQPGRTFKISGAIKF